MRPDKRTNDQLRPTTFTPNVIRWAEGSCMVEAGDTKVLCTATIETKIPSWMKQQGITGGWITAEYGMLPRSCDQRIQRDKKSGRTYEIQRLIGRSLRSVLDVEKLCDCTITIDCDVIQGDGGTRTASINGGFIAMMIALEGLKKSGKIKQVPVKDFCAAISVGIFEDQLVLDLNYDEDSAAQVDMNVVMTGKGNLVEVQGTAEEKTFSRDTMNKMIDLAEKGIKEIIEKQKTVLSGLGIAVG